MKHTTSFTILLSLICVFGSHTAISAENLPHFKIMTEAWIPYQFEENGELHGISVDVLLLMLKKIGSNQGREDIVLYPWSRGYKTVLQQKNTILFLTTRTREREKLFKWVGPLFSNQTCLMAKKSRVIRIKNNAELQNYFYGAVHDDVGEQLLLSKGVEPYKIEINTTNLHVIRMLDVNRLDMVAQSLHGFQQEVRKLDIDPEQFECAYVLNTSDIFYAFHHDTPEWIIALFQQAFDELKQQGKIKEIFNNYSESFPEELHIK